VRDPEADGAEETLIKLPEAAITEDSEELELVWVLVSFDGCVVTQEVAIKQRNSVANAEK